MNHEVIGLERSGKFKSDRPAIVGHFVRGHSPYDQNASRPLIYDLNCSSVFALKCRSLTRNAHYVSLAKFPIAFAIFASAVGGGLFLLWVKVQQMTFGTSDGDVCPINQFGTRVLSLHIESCIRLKPSAFVSLTNWTNVLILTMIGRSRC